MAKSLTDILNGIKNDIKDGTLTDEDNKKLFDIAKQQNSNSKDKKEMIPVEESINFVKATKAQNDKEVR